LFHVNDVQQALSDAPGRQTVYRVLRQLETDDWIRREVYTWRPDIKVNGFGDVKEHQDQDRLCGFDLNAEDFLDG
jgi:hypothetical protein